MKIPNLTPSQQVLLVFLAEDKARGIDPIRIQKGLFLFMQEAPNKWLPRKERYCFTPYHWGPCSFQIYSDLDLLSETGYILVSGVPDRSWKLYSLTPKGGTLARLLAKRMALTCPHSMYHSACY